MTKPFAAEKILKSLEESFPQLSKFFYVIERPGMNPVIEMPCTEYVADYIEFGKEDYIALLNELDQNKAWDITDTMVRWGLYYVKIGPNVTYAKAKFLREFLDWKYDSA